MIEPTDRSDDYYQTYNTEAHTRLTHHFYCERVSKEYLIEALQQFISAADRLDRIKKALFYGRSYTVDDSVTEQNYFRSYTNPDLVHSIIGNATEAGELAELLLKSVVTDQPLNTAKFIEESGDQLFYITVGLAHRKVSLEEVLRLNLLKLRLRYPDGWSHNKAAHRDLEAEQSLFEGY